MFREFVFQLETRDRDADNFTAISRPQLEYAWLHQTNDYSKAEAKEDGAEEKEGETKDDKEVDGPPKSVSGSYKELPPIFRLLPVHNGPQEGMPFPATGADEVTITVFLDTLAPLTEAKWLKTGDVDEWLSTLQGFHQRQHEQTWHDKIEVVDPDPVSCDQSLSPINGPFTDLI